jgi:hypothetical protein
MNPWGRPPSGLTPEGKSNSFWGRLQDHFNDDPKWDGINDSAEIFALGQTVLPAKTLVRVAKLPISVSMCVVLTATSGDTPIGGPAPPPAIPWFEVAFGTEGARYRYTCFAGVEIIGGTGLVVQTIPFDTGGTDHKLRATAWICTAPPAMNVVAVH